MASDTPTTNTPTSRRLFHDLRLVDQLRYLFRRLILRSHWLDVRLKAGPRLILRTPGDRRVAWEVFTAGLYTPPAPVTTQRPYRIVDLGANIGLSSLYFATRYPDAEVLAFEPHSGFADRCEEHIRVNGLTNRVRVVRAAAGVANSTGRLSDAGAGSSLVIPRGGPFIDVQVKDWIAEVGDRPIDLLKMDVEGAEYELLNDPRFAGLKVPVLVLECHAVPERGLHPDACLTRLHALGYRTVCHADSGCLMVWATRDGKDG